VLCLPENKSQGNRLEEYFKTTVIRPGFFPGCMQLGPCIFGCQTSQWCYTGAQKLSYEGYEMKQPFYGVLFALAAFAAWGLLPAYWKQMQAAVPFEILCHRVVWSCVFVFIIICYQKR
jgi:hypothetical protein